MKSILQEIKEMGLKHADDLVYRWMMDNPGERAVTVYQGITACGSVYRTSLGCFSGATHQNYIFTDAQREQFIIAYQEWNLL